MDLRATVHLYPGAESGREGKGSEPGAAERGEYEHLELDDVVREFLIESYENLDHLDRDLIALESEPQDRERLANVFRTIHTIKGTCGFLGYVKLEAVTHAGENLLSRLRDGQLLLNPAITSGLLALVDAVRLLLAHIEKTGQEGDGEFSALLDSLKRLNDGATATSSAPRRVVEENHSPGSSENDTESGEAAPEPGALGLSDGSIRVDVVLLDKLMTLVGELVLARNQIIQLTSVRNDPIVLSTCQRLNLITTELQEGVMKTRMQPIGNVWQRFPRVVRDLALSCGKHVRIEMEGQETELDKTILSSIKDPLTHLVRNAIDHGIESPVVRQARGKPVQGRLLLRAFHEGGQVHIEFSDDGGGIDLERIKLKALERGLRARDEIDRLSERELLNLVFLPGFSTADRITNVSGRGVGMDVVKTNIEKIGGTLDLQSRFGQGTAIKIKIPLTLAIIPALLVTSGGDRYAIPQVSLLELVRLKGERARRGIERLAGTPVYRLRGQLLPLVYLHRELQVEPVPNPNDDAVNIVVLQADDRSFGLVVERIHDTEEIVVKPLGRQMKGIAAFAGATIRGDGQVALILDVLGLAQSAGVVRVVRDRLLAEQTTPVAEISAATRTVLLVGLGTKYRFAIPLTQVARLEEIPRSAVEKTARNDVAQYRGQILPLIHLSQFLGHCPGTAVAGPESELLSVVVHGNEGRQVGLVVDRILDIAEMPLTDWADAAGRASPGVVIQQQVAELLDLNTLGIADLMTSNQPVSPSRRLPKRDPSAASGLSHSC